MPGVGSSVGRTIAGGTSQDAETSNPDEALDWNCTSCFQGLPAEISLACGPLWWVEVNGMLNGGYIKFSSSGYCVLSLSTSCFAGEFGALRLERSKIRSPEINPRSPCSCYGTEPNKFWALLRASSGQMIL